MKFLQARTALGLALLLAGCSAQPATNAPMAASNDPLGLGDAVAARYTALSVMATPLAIANVSTSSEVTGFTANASSDRNPQFFAIANLSDGNLHSAWGPAANDAAPSVTLNLAQATSVTGLGIKMDAGATFDVAVSNGGAFTTIATNVTSEARALDFINLKASTAKQVRLSFHVQQGAQLLVCEVKVFTGGAVGSPSPVPSVSPSVAPPPTQCLTLAGTGTIIETFPEGGLKDGEEVTVNASQNTGGAASGTFIIDSINDNDPNGGFHYNVSSLTNVNGKVTIKGTFVGILGGSATITGHESNGIVVVDTVLGTIVDSQTGQNDVIADIKNPNLAQTRLTLTETTGVCTVQTPIPTPVPTPPCITFSGQGSVIQGGPNGTFMAGVTVSFSAAIATQAAGGNGTIDLKDINDSSTSGNTFRVTSITKVNDELTFFGTKIIDDTVAIKITAHEVGSTAVIDTVFEQGTDGSGHLVTVENITNPSLGTVTLLEGTCQNPQ